MTTIPASQIVSATPSVLSAGGRALDLNGIILTQSTRVPMNQVVRFPTTLSVANYFGPNSIEASLANAYFLGFNNSDRKPGALLFSQFPAVSVAAWLRGGSVAGMTLGTLQSLNGVLTLTIDGVGRTTSSINLSSATSFSAAAALIQTGLAAALPTGASFTGSITGNTMTVSAIGSGTIQQGMVVSGSSVLAGSVIVGYGTGTGGTGTYLLSTSFTVASEALTSAWANPTVSYDAQSGGFLITSGTTGATSTMSFASGSLAAPLALTQAGGAVNSQGSLVLTPAAAMNVVSTQTMDWATFMTTWEPLQSVKLQFAAWNDAQNNRFMYVCWDTDAAPATSLSAPTSTGGLIKANGNDGVAMVYLDPIHAAFIMGVQASLDFTAINGRATSAFRTQPGLIPSVTDATTAQNLLGNGYNFFGSYATANDQFNFLYNGQVSGPFLWIDSYINQIYMLNQFQLALMTLLTMAKSIPYNHEGFSMIEAALGDPIRQALDFGAIRAGVALSQLQASLANEDVGAKIDTLIQNRGWYLLVADPGPQARAARQSPRCKFWYTDGQSVQQININSIEIQ